MHLKLMIERRDQQKDNPSTNNSAMLEQILEAALPGGSSRGASSSGAPAGSGTADPTLTTTGGGLGDILGSFLGGAPAAGAAVRGEALLSQVEAIFAVVLGVTQIALGLQIMLRALIMIGILTEQAG